MVRVQNMSSYNLKNGVIFSYYFHLNWNTSKEKHLHANIKEF